MSRTRNTIIFDREILNYLLERFVNDRGHPGGGETGLCRAYTGELNKFINDKKDLSNQLKESVSNLRRSGEISVSTMERAFGLKQKGIFKASIHTLDIMSLFRSDLRLDWNSTIRTVFPVRTELLFENSKPIGRLGPSDQTSIRAIVSSLSDMAEKDFGQLGPSEIELIQDQLQRRNTERTAKVEKLGSLTIPSERDPFNPEYPPAPYFTPNFPATPHREIDVPGFRNVILKDESQNPGGTHKSRMGHEITVIARRWYERNGVYPVFSIISSGTAAIAIQYFFKLFKVESQLRVIVDENISLSIATALQENGCKIYPYNLSAQSLSGEDIRKITNNEQGIDITCRPKADPLLIKYYDWLSFEVLNLQPDFVFCPFGTGDLFGNLVRTLRQEFAEQYHDPDPRLKTDISQLTRCNFVGATTNNPKSKLEKLYSAFLPTMVDHKRNLADLRDEKKLVGKDSDIRFVEEEFVDKALDVAEDNQIACEPSGIAGLALLLQMQECLDPEKRIVVINTGKTQLYPEVPLPKK